MMIVVEEEDLDLQVILVLFIRINVAVVAPIQGHLLAATHLPDPPSHLSSQNSQPKLNRSPSIYGFRTSRETSPKMF